MLDETFTLVTSALGSTSIPKIQGPQELICDWDSVPYELFLFGPTYFINSVAGEKKKKRK